MWRQWPRGCRRPAVPSVLRLRLTPRRAASSAAAYLPRGARLTSIDGGLMRLHSVLLAVGAGFALGCADSPTGITPNSQRPSLIISGQPDAGQHPYVGLLVFDDAEGPAWRCSGSLLSPTVVL